MFIKKINITSFGKLSDLNIEPINGLNIIYAPNESGKTTLLSFVKYIFYGTKQKKLYGDITFKERYTPWSGMPTDGSLEFEKNNREYLIERTERERTSKLCITDLSDGEILKTVQNPGMEFFGIGEKAFTDSCFVHNMTSISEGQSDGELVSRFSYSENENNTYLNIKNKLTERLLNLLSPKRKTSAISVIDEKIKDRRDKLRYINNSLKEIADKSDSIKSNEVSIKELKEKNFSLRLLKAKEYKEFLEKIKNEITGEYTFKGNSNNKKSFSIMLIFICFSVAFGLSAIINPLFIYPFAFFFAGFTVCLLNLIRVKQLNKNIEKIINDKNKLLKFRLEEIEEKLSRLNNILEKGRDMSNSDITYINTFTNSKIDDIIVRNETEISDLKAMLERNFHLKDQNAALNDELYDVTSEIYSLEAAKLSIKNDADIINKAITILDNSYNNAKGSFFPDISKKTLEIFSEITDNKLDAVITDDNFSISLNKSGHLRSSKFLSTGAADALYFSLRIAIINKMSDCATDIPLFLDDILSNCDDTRAYKILDILYSLSKDKQIFLCTCRSREGEYFKNKNDVNIISL